MARHTTLEGWDLEVRKGRELDPETGEGVRVWGFVYTERDSGDTITFGFKSEVRDAVIAGLTGVELPLDRDLASL
jgi:hypothetical protein